MGNGGEEGGGEGGSDYKPGPVQVGGESGGEEA